MGSTLITGGAGFIGSHLARRLAERGEEVRLTVRPDVSLENLDFEHTRVECDILDRRAVRRAMRGVRRLFHTAGLTSLRAPADALFAANVQGTRVVLEEALRAGVEHVTYTSSAMAVGPATGGRSADETQVFRAGALGIPYVNAKHEAEVEALRLVGLGLPVVIVCPAVVFGAGDVECSSTSIVGRFLRREIPAYVDGTVNIVDVEDVTDGHLLAEEHGRIGERYILGNRNFTLDRLFADLARISGVEPPALKLPLPAAMVLAQSLERLGGRPLITPMEIKTASQNWAFSSASARRELGYRPAHHEETLEATVNWYREREPDLLSPRGARQALPLRATGALARSLGGAWGTLRGAR